jgi:hypothetical protein
MRVSEQLQERRITVKYVSSRKQAESQSIRSYKEGYVLPELQVGCSHIHLISSAFVYQFQPLPSIRLIVVYRITNNYSFRRASSTISPAAHLCNHCVADRRRIVD